MEYPLSITSIVGKDEQGNSCRSSVVVVMAEAELGIHSERGLPDFFFGKLIDLPIEDIRFFKFVPGVEVMFRGSGYQFAELSEAGVFKLVRGYCE